MISINLTLYTVDAVRLRHVLPNEPLFASNNIHSCHVSEAKNLALECADIYAYHFLCFGPFRASCAQVNWRVR